MKKLELGDFFRFLSFPEHHVLILILEYLYCRYGFKIDVLNGASRKKLALMEGIPTLGMQEVQYLLVEVLYLHPWEEAHLPQ